jgi:hypothetical protein
MSIQHANVFWVDNFVVQTWNIHFEVFNVNIRQDICVINHNLTNNDHIMLSISIFICFKYIINNKITKLLRS